jgi:hypothetical protein
MSSGATPQEIYDTIRGVVEDNYYTYKHQASQAYELLALLNGNGKGHIEAYDEYKGSTVSSVSDVMPPWGHSDMEALKYTDEELNAMCDVAEKANKVKKWVLPVEYIDDECFVSFPEDLLEAANLKEGDQIEWVDQGNGSYLLKKVANPSWVRGNELAKVKTYQEMIDDGWTMTADGFWIKE